MGTKSLPTWVSVLIASVIIVGMLAIAAVGGAAFFIYGHVHTSVTPNETAQSEFVQARARFEGQQPLIELHRGEEPIIHRELVRTAPEAQTRGDSMRPISCALRTARSGLTEARSAFGSCCAGIY